MSTITFNNLPALPYALEEAVNRLMININFTGKDTKKIMVSSSVPNEGKSFIAIHLWRKLAQAGYKTIMVDGDLRNSVLRDRYKFTSDDQKIRGISYYLSGQITLDEAIYSTNIENGDILPLAKAISNPANLLQGDTFHEMLDTLSERYQYVIIDTAPLDAVGDGERIASLCDGALLVVRAGATPKNMIRQSMRLLERAGCPLIGTVLNRVEAGGYFSKYGGHYGKYGKYGKYGYGKYGRYGKYGYGAYGYGPENSDSKTKKSDK